MIPRFLTLAVELAGEGYEVFCACHGYPTGAGAWINLHGLTEAGAMGLALRFGGALTIEPQEGVHQWTVTLPDGLRLYGCLCDAAGTPIRPVLQ